MTIPILFQQNNDGITPYAIPTSIIIIILYVFASFGIHEYKRTIGTSPCFHESSVATLLGVLVGSILKIFTGKSVVFDKNLFFYLVLPPVIFSAGYSLRRRNFFRYFDLIFTFGILGTLIQFILVTIASKFIASCFNINNLNIFKFDWIDAAILSAVLSASDEVSAMSLVRMRDFPRMGALIFGEGVLNDALAIVICKVLLDWKEKQIHSTTTEEEVYSIYTLLNLVSTVFTQLFFSTFIGSSFALLNAKILKRFKRLKEHPVHQTSLVLLFGYLSYAVAESFDISGIVSVFVSGLTLSHYSWHSLSKTAQLSTKVCLLSLSDIAEAFAFAYVGLSLWSSNVLGNAFFFALFILVALILARLITIFGLCKLGSIIASNKFELPLSEQLGFSIAGLVRGSLCWAQVLQVDADKDLFVTTVLIIIMITTLGGGIILPLILPLLVGGNNAKNEVSVSITSPPYVSISTTINSPTKKVIYLPDYHSQKKSEQYFDLSPMRAEFDNSNVSPTPIREQNDNTNISAVLYLLWVKFDEIIMKPTFGGSIRDESRSYLLEETKSMTIGAILKDTENVKDIVSLSKDHRVEKIDNGIVGRKIVLFDANELNEDEYTGVIEELDENNEKKNHMKTKIINNNDLFNERKTTSVYYGSTDRTRLDFTNEEDV